MTDIQEDVTLEAHIRAVDEGATEVFFGIVEAVKGVSGFLVGAGEGVAAAFGAATAAAGILGGIVVGVFKETIDNASSYAEAVAKVAFLTGETTEKSSGLISAFRAQGFTTDEATNSMQRLTMRLGGIDMQFKSTGKLSASAKEQLKELGLTTDDLTKHGSDLSAQLPRIIDHLKNMTDPLERDRISMQLFGRNFGSIAPLIAAGGDAFAKAEGDANRFGVSLSEKQVHAMEAYKSAIETTKEAIQGITFQIAFYALPYFQKLEDLIKQGVAWWESLNPSVHKTALEILKIVGVFGTLFGGAAALGKVIIPLVRDVPLLGTAFSGVLGPLVPFLGILGPLVGIFLILEHLFVTNAQAASLLAPVFSMAKLVFKEFLDLLDIGRDVFNQLVGDVLPKGQSAFGSLAQTVRDFVYNGLTQVGVWLLNAKEWIADHRVQIGLWASKIEDLAGDIAKFLSDTLTPFMTSTGGLKDFILNQLIPALSQIVWPVVDPAIQAAWAWLKDNGTTVGTAIKDIAAGYAAIKTVGTIAGAVSWVYAFAGAFKAVQYEEGLAIALQRTLGIEAAVNAAKATVAWVRSAAISLAAWAADAAETVAIWVMLATESVVNAVKAGVAWAFSADAAFTAWTISAQKIILLWIKTAAAAVVNAAKAAAAWVWEGIVADSATTVSAARMAAAWIASSAVAVASAARAAAGWLLANGAMLIVRAATIAWTAVQWLLNAALAANPIGLIIIAIALLVAGIIWAYNNVGWFRDAVNAAWKMLQGWGAWITSTLLPGIGGFFSWLGTTASSVVGGVGNAFSSLGTTVHNVWNGIASAIKSFINTIIDHIDTFIKGVNSMGAAVQQIPGVPHFGAIPLIPHLYTGAVVTRPTLAVVGDRGTEVVATLAQAFQAGAAAVRSGGVGGNGMITIEFHVDGRLMEKRSSKVTGNRMRLQGSPLGSAA